MVKHSHSTALTLGALAFLREASCCSIIAVGKTASATGYPVVTHTDDGAGANDVRFVRVPRKTWPEGSMRPIYLWQDPYPRIVSKAFMTPDYYPLPGQPEHVPIAWIPQPAETWAYWDVDYGMQNEWGLSIGESTGNAKTYGWPATADKPYGYNKMGIEDLSKIALERCKTAKCAAQTMGDLAVEHGFYSADTGDPSKPDTMDSAEILVLADTSDVWMFNVMTGAHNASAIWGAKRIPDDHVALVADSFSFSLQLDDPENNIYSDGVEKLAEEMGWRKTEKEAPNEFDFFLAYGAELEEPAKTLMGYYVGRRVWRGYTLLAPEEGSKLDPNTTHTVNGGRLPTSLAARPGSVTRNMIMAVHRDHYEGTPYDLTKGMAAGPWGNPNRQDQAGPGQWERAFSLTRTVLSYVLEPRPNGRSISWLSYDAPHGSVYLPFYGAATSPPPASYHTGDMSVFSRDTAWWAFNLANSWSNLNFELINGEMRRKAEAREAEAQMLITVWETEADMAAKGLPLVMQPATQLHTAGLDILTQRSHDYALETVNEWWRFIDYLFGKYSRMVVDSSEGKAEGRQMYPEWWLSSPEVGFRSWTPDGPYHGIVCKNGEFCDSKAATYPYVPSAAPTTATTTEKWNATAVALAAEEPVATPAISMGTTSMVVAASATMSAMTYFVGLSHGRRETAAQYSSLLG